MFGTETVLIADWSQFSVILIATVSIFSDLDSRPSQYLVILIADRLNIQ